MEQIRKCFLCTDDSYKATFKLSLSVLQLLLKTNLRALELRELIFRIGQTLSFRLWFHVYLITVRFRVMHTAKMKAEGIFACRGSQGSSSVLWHMSLCREQLTVWELDSWFPEENESPKDSHNKTVEPILSTEVTCHHPFGSMEVTGQHHIQKGGFLKSKSINISRKE